MSRPVPPRVLSYAIFCIACTARRVPTLRAYALDALQRRGRQPLKIAISIGSLPIWDACALRNQLVSAGAVHSRERHIAK